MPRIVAHLPRELYHKLGDVEVDKPSALDLLQMEWREIAARAFSRQATDIEVIWQGHDRADNAAVITLDVEYTVGDYGFVAGASADCVRDALSEELRNALIGSPLLPPGEYAAWAKPQHGARYLSGTKEPLPGNE